MRVSLESGTPFSRKIALLAFIGPTTSIFTGIGPLGTATWEQAEKRRVRITINEVRTSF
jgi:hypothetical protein